MKMLLIDDHPLILSAMHSVIMGLDESIETVALESAAQCRDLLREGCEFDLVLLDLQLGDASGFDLLSEFRCQYPALPVVVVSASDATSDIVQALEHGAMGFVPKRASHLLLAQALTHVLQGGVFVPPMTPGLTELVSYWRATEAAMRAEEEEPRSVRRLFMPNLGPTPAPRAELDVAGGLDSQPANTFLSGGVTTRSTTALATTEVTTADSTAPDTTAPGSSGSGGTAWGLSHDTAEQLLREELERLSLTPRQCEVMMLLMQGKSNKVIARDLRISVETVKDHVAAVLRVLGVSSRTQAVLAVGQHLGLRQRVAQAASEMASSTASLPSSQPTAASAVLI